MSTIKIEMFPAENGDCFLVSCKGETTTNILIDLGYKSTYDNYVKPRLKELHEKGQVLDLIVLTHIDEDHIEGGLKFFDENGVCTEPKIIEVKEVWHNSYRHLTFNRDEGEMQVRDLKRIQNKVRVWPRNDDTESKVGAQQGTRVAGLLYKNRYPWNTSFEGHAVNSDGESILVNREVKLTLITPTQTQLEKLKKSWLVGLHKLFPSVPLTDDQVFDDAVEYVSHFMIEEGIPNLSEKVSVAANLFNLANTKFREERSVINGSSITFILEFAGKRVLFLADSHPTVVEAQLRNLFPDESLPLQFDAIKVSHHGSKGNTNNELLKMVDSDVFLISTDGSKHGHPHMETLARIVVRGQRERGPRSLCFNYETSSSINMNREDWKKTFDYSVLTAPNDKSFVVNL